MKDRPIIFGEEMVKAILDGRKTQTRRVIKPQPDAGVRFSPFVPGQVEDGHGQEMRCPYGVERLWVRETWATSRVYDTDRPSAIPDDASLWWMADKSSHRFLGAKQGKIRPSIFMPRWASRITLNVVSVRAERVQDISHNDSLAEGINIHAEPSNYGSGSRYRDEFAAIWDSINAKRGFSWALNPWVWVIKFERVS